MATNNDHHRRTESYVFYLQNDPDEGSSTPLPSLLGLLPGEQEICSPCNRVIFYPSFSDNRQGVLGSLHCTMLRLIFVPMGEVHVHTVPFPTSKIFCNFRYEIALLNVHSVNYATSVDTKKYKPLTSFFQHSDQLSLVKIFCKDFRVFTFDFKMSTDGYKMLINSLFKHAFPARLENLFTSASIYSTDGANNEWQSFDKRTTWELELKRLNVSPSHWRVTHLNECYRHIESYPQFFVVSSLWPDNRIVEACGIFCERRVPVWSWSSPNGSAIVRSAKINTFSEVMEKHWSNYELAVSHSHPHPQSPMPVTIDVNVSAKEIATSAESLRKLCSIESPTAFWVVDNRWNSELEQTGWLNLISKCLSISDKIIAHIVDESKSVIVREATNSDVACIVSCLAQLCLDKFFRSFEGFHVLIQKEWVALAHPFALRLTGLSRNGRNDDEIAPVFLLFLDCVHQLCVQFPWEFEFSQFYLIALWDLALTGLTKTFLFNNLKDCSSLNGSKLRNAWSTSQFYKADYMKLFRNPVYAFINGLAPLNNGGDATSSTTKILRPRSSLRLLEVWDDCFLRWSAPSQVLRGGTVQTYVDTLDICGDISERLKEILFVDVTSTPTTSSNNNEEKQIKNQILRRYRVAPLDLDASSSMETITSAFPFSFETLPIPDCLYTVPVRTEAQTSQNNNTSRSTLELSATTESQVDVRRLSVSRLAMEMNFANENHHRIDAALQLNQFWSPKENNSTRYSLKSSSGVYSPKMNSVVCEMQNNVRFRLLNPQTPSTPPLAIQEDDFLNTSV